MLLANIINNILYNYFNIFKNIFYLLAFINITSTSIKQYIMLTSSVL